MLFLIIPQILSVSIEAVAQNNSRIGMPLDIEKKASTKETIQRRMTFVLNMIFRRFPQLFVDSLLNILQNSFSHQSAAA